jgi:hypothetical protein
MQLGFDFLLTGCILCNDRGLVYSQASGRRYLRARRPELYAPLVEPHPPGHEPVTSPGWTLARPRDAGPNDSR